MVTTSPKKKTKSAPSHPPYLQMVSRAIGQLKEKGGSSRAHILKWIMSQYNLGTDAAKVNSRMRVALRNGLKSGKFLAPKGPSGKFKLSESKKATATKTKKARKPRSKSPKKAAAKKTTTKKAKSPKKKSPAKKKPAAKKAKSPAKKKTPKKTKKSPKKTAKK